MLITGRVKGTGEGRGSEGQSLSMWLSSTESEIALWGGETGGGESLRTGLPAPQRSVPPPPPPRAPTEKTLSTAATLYDPLANKPKAKEGHARAGVGSEGRGECLLSDPVAVIPGQPGVVRHRILNNR